MSTAFVTGGSGYLGRNLIRTLRARGVAVRALARSAAAAATVSALGAAVVHGDLDEEQVLQTAMHGCDVVYHAAAIADVWGDPQQFQRVNIDGTAHVLAAARAAGVPKLVHVSSEAVLIDGRPIRWADEQVPRPRTPLGLYPWSKGQAEESVLAANSADLTTVIVRPRFIWGNDDSTVLPRLVKSVQAGQFAWIGGGRHLTSTCHVANVCVGMLQAAAHGQGGAIYFLTDGLPVELRTFLRDLLATQDVDAGQRVLPLWLAKPLASATELVWRGLRLSSLPPLDRTTVALIGQEVTVNDSRARDELGYHSPISIDAGLAALRRGELLVA